MLDKGLLFDQEDVINKNSIDTEASFEISRSLM